MPSTSSNRRASASRPSPTWTLTRPLLPLRWRPRAAPRRRRRLPGKLAWKPCVVRSPVPWLRQRHPGLGSALVVFIVAAPPRLEPILVPAPRGEVEKLVGPHQGLGATGIGGVGVVDSAVLEREDAHTLLL